MASAEGGPSVAWRYAQCFGDREAETCVDADKLTAVQHSHTGRFLATGDKGGRVVIFERAESEQNLQSSTHDKDQPPATSEYRFYAEFQSHESEFDYLKSLEIEEKINQIAWCRGSCGALQLLTTNDKTVKLWRVSEKQQKQVVSSGIQQGRFGGRARVKKLVVPKLSRGETTVVAKHRRSFSNAHAYLINSISTCADGETFLSADDLRINVWSLESTKSSFNVVDMKPGSMEDLTEVISAAQYHPTHSHHFAFGSSVGLVRLADMRASALCDSGAKVFSGIADASDSAAFASVTANVHDVQFSPDGSLLFARTYMSATVWDVRMEKPLHSIPVQQHLGPVLGELYESDCIFDKFRISPCGDNRHFATGTYDDKLLIVDAKAGVEQSVDIRTLTPSARHRTLQDRGGVHTWEPAGPAVHTIDFTKRIGFYSWHPSEDTIAVAGLSSLAIFEGSRRAGRASSNSTSVTSPSVAGAEATAESFPGSFGSDSTLPSEYKSGGGWSN